MNQFISSTDAAKVLRVHRVAVARLIRQGKLPAIKIANRWLVDREVLEEFAKGYEGRRGRPTGWSKQKGGKS